MIDAPRLLFRLKVKSMTKNKSNPPGNVSLVCEFFLNVVIILFNVFKVLEEIKVTFIFVYLLTCLLPPALERWRFPLQRIIDFHRATIL